MDAVYLAIIAAFFLLTWGLFEPFFTTKGEGGTGLGLATVFGIVKQSGGGIWVYSEPRQGTIFKMYLPAAERAARSEAEPARHWVHRGSETVLLVKDQGAVRIVAREALKKAGYAVIEARDGPEALALTARHDGPIQLVLTDLVMPRMNGPELVTRLLALRSGFKKLFMAGHADETVAHHGLVEPLSDFLEKPFTRYILLEDEGEVFSHEPPLLVASALGGLQIPRQPDEEADLVSSEILQAEKGALLEMDHRL